MAEGTAQIKISISPEQAKAGAAVVERAIEEVKKSARGLRGDLLDTFSSRSFAVAGMVGAIGTVTNALVASSRAAAQYVGEIKDFAQASSLATREASAYAYVASLSNTSISDLSAGFAKLNANMMETMSGTGDGARLFNALGVSVTDVFGHMRSTSDVFLDVSDRLRVFNDDGAKSTVITKLLGNGMQEMARQGKDALRDQITEAERLGRTLDDTAVAKTEAWEKSTAKLQQTIKSISTDIGMSLLPALTDTSTILQKIVQDFQDGGRAIAGFMQSAPRPPGPLGFVRPEGSDRNLRILPPPPGLDTVQIEKNPYFDPSLGNLLGQDMAQKPFDAHIRQYYDRERDQLELLFRGAASQRSEVEDKVERMLEDLKRDNQRTIDQITKDFAGDTPEEQQRAEGIRIRDRSIMEYREKLREQDISDARLYYQSQMDMAKALFANDEDIAQKQRALLREELAYKLGIAKDSADRLIFLSKHSGDPDAVDSILQKGDPTLSMRAKDAIRASAVAEDIQLAERANGDFIAGWTRGLQAYVSRTENAFNLSNDMARRTAQTMEQGFQRFFFDGMEGRFKSFEDVLQGVLDFTKQIVSQMAAQLVTIGIIKPGASAIANVFGLGAGSTPIAAESGGYPINYERFGGIERFSLGGIATSPKRMALGGRMVEFGEGAQAEAFVPLPDGRTIPVTMRYAGNLPTADTRGVSVQNNVKIEVKNLSSAEVQVAQPRQQSDGTTVYEIVIQSVKKGFASGRFDNDIGRFGMRPQPYTR